VNRRVAAARLLTLLCLTALLVMQAVGGFRAYVCDCGGKVTWTTVDHCHGPHSAACHDHESNVPDRHDENSGDRQDHKQIVQELQVRAVESFQLPAIVPVLLTWLPEVFRPLAGWENTAVYRPVVGADTSPPPGVTVARTVVFII